MMRDGTPSVREEVNRSGNRAGNCGLDMLGAG